MENQHAITVIGRLTISMAIFNNYFDITKGCPIFHGWLITPATNPKSLMNDMNTKYWDYKYIIDI